MASEHPTDLLEDYALRQLSPAAETIVAEHVATCTECARRVRSLEQTLGFLALAAPVRMPPPDVEDALLKRIGDLQRGEPPALRARANAMEHSADDEQRAVTSARGRFRQFREAARATQWRRRAMYGLVAVAATLLLALGVLGSQLHSARQDNAALAAQVRQEQVALAIVNAPNAVVRRLAPTERAAGEARGTMAVNPANGQGILLIANLPRLPAAQTYEFWVVQGQAGSASEVVLPVATFVVRTDGSAQVSFVTRLAPSELRNAGISIEKAGGVAQPDSPMIMLFTA